MLLPGQPEPDECLPASAAGTYVEAGNSYLPTPEGFRSGHEFDIQDPEAVLQEEESQLPDEEPLLSVSMLGRVAIRGFSLQ